MSFPFLLAAIGGFALNDYYDADKDRISKPYRAIPSNRLTRRTVLLISVASLIAATLVAVFAARDSRELVLYLGAILGVSLYNVFVRYVSLSKTFLTAIVSALPLLFSIVIFHFATVYLLLPLATSFFVLGREWLMDIWDITGDEAKGMITFPMLLGTKWTAKLGFVFQLMAVIILIPVVIETGSRWNLAVLELILASVIIFSAMWFSSYEHWRKVIRGLWIPMLLGILMIYG